MDKYMKKAAIMALTGVLCAGSLTACGSKKEEKTETDPKAAVATVNGEEIPAGVLGFMARYQQMQTESLYQSMLGSTAAGMWDTVADEESGETYGQQSVNDILDQLETMYILRAHAADYGVELTDEETKKIEDAAAAFAEANGEEVLKAMVTDQDCVKEVLELMTYQQKMRDPIVADVDTEVSDEEAQQTSVTYVKVEKAPAEESAQEESADGESIDQETTDEEPVDEEAADDNTADDESAKEEPADEESTDKEPADEESTDEEAADDKSEDEKNTDDESADKEEADAAAEAKEIAEKILETMMDDPSQDMRETALAIDEDVTITSTNYTTNDPDDTAVPDEVKAVVEGLKDGEMYKELVETDELYYVVRLDAAFDEEETEEEKESIISERESELYTEVTEGWVEEAEFEIHEDVKAGITITSTELFTMKAVEEETDEATEEELEETSADADLEDLDEGEDAQEISEDMDSIENAEELPEDMEEELEAAENPDANAEEDEEMEMISEDEGNADEDTEAEEETDAEADTEE